jgi:hypothetical protein
VCRCAYAAAAAKGSRQSARAGAMSILAEVEGQKSADCALAETDD